jgi:hypothetical protein
MHLDAILKSANHSPSASFVGAISEVLTEEDEDLHSLSLDTPSNASSSEKKISKNGDPSFSDIMTKNASGASSASREHAESTSSNGMLAWLWRKSTGKKNRLREKHQHGQVARGKRKEDDYPYV